MPTLIAYATKHGTTRKYAEHLAKEISCDVTVINLKENPDVDISPYDTVIIGSAIYVGQVRKEVKDFCVQKSADLQHKRLGLFTCGWQEGPEAEKQLQAAYPAELVQAAVATAPLGGEVNLTNMNLGERLVMRAVAKVKQSASHYSPEAVVHFANAIFAD